MSQNKEGSGKGCQGKVSSKRDRTEPITWGYCFFYTEKQKTWQFLRKIFPFWLMWLLCLFSNES